MSRTATMVLNLLILVGAIFLPRIFGMSLWALAVPAIGVLTFFALLPEKPMPGKEEEMRSAIAIALITVYLVLIGAVAFSANGSGWSEAQKTLVQSFSLTISVVIGFYFGSSAYLQRKREEREESGKNPGCHLFGWR